MSHLPLAYEELRNLFFTGRKLQRKQVFVFISFLIEILFGGQVQI